MRFSTFLPRGAVLFARAIYFSLDTYLLRWIAPVLAPFTAAMAFFLDFDLDEIRKNYPNCTGAVDLFDVVNFYKALLWMAVVTAAGAVYNVMRQKSISKLTKENGALALELGGIAENILSLFEAVLLALASKLDLDEAGTERVSIYVHRPHSASFVPCGRFSHNPNLKKKGRSSLPDGEGCITRAWEEGWHFNNAFPCSTDERAYREYMKDEYNIPRNTTRRMKMKPQLIAAKRVSSYDVPVAVIVVESTQTGGLVEERLKDLLTELADEYGRMLSAVGKYIPDPHSAEEVGL